MIGKLKKHELRKIWKNEATDFTAWLEENLESLSEALGSELTLVKREHQIGSFSADIVATDESGQKVIIENQLEKTDHTYLGQIITYVSNLVAKSVIWISGGLNFSDRALTQESVDFLESNIKTFEIGNAHEMTDLENPERI